MRHFKTILLTILLIQAYTTHAHLTHEKPNLKKWHFNDTAVAGTFLLYKKGIVYLEDSERQIISAPLSAFTKTDRSLLDKKIEEIEMLNREIKLENGAKNHLNFPAIAVLLLLLISLYLFIYIRQVKGSSFLRIPLVIFVGLLLSATDPEFIRNAFLPFAPDVNTSWDSNYFYVESKGIPATHPMMTGISNHGWQQQVPIPQCYIGANSWSIPLNPVISASPIPVNELHFTKGAIAIAVNGVPIFNPYTNTGVDAYLDGQLDSYGGHSGKGDDYHYHIAPLHLYDQTTSTLPIAYAFDGFAVYGSLEPDGVSMTSLDANHGHLYNGEYHYHGTAAAPYMIANMVGEVTEDTDKQLIPQASASPVRTENWTPLSGALITSCLPNGTNNGYNLSYTLNGITGYGTKYYWNGSVYTFDYTTPGGSTQVNYNGFLQCELPLFVSENTEKTALQSYPNPFTGHIHLSGTTSSEYYKLLNSKGQLVYAGKNVEQEDFSNLPAGVYYLQIKGKKNRNIKLIKP